MFKQITNLNGSELYLIASLWIFLVFFIIVGIMLFRMNKEHISYMKDIPFQEDDNNNSQSSDSL
ncbi:hypothetical protein ACFX5U_03920 [Sphingobacterium sp. SG20118]|uniref:hypothetical protein n=1 Tax=Sphingobacterium TaxID=28453 RepID=UPI0004F882F8|nr:MULTISPECIES: hypothetical protein [Sphingobacterium]AIM36197.1 hypothetical protein KO02_05435 [Sphingobacterium sp. ML3W]MDH5827677.1 hypothetical protein [Sphingobacterium faecium]